MFSQLTVVPLHYLVPPSYDEVVNAERTSVTESTSDVIEGH